MSAVRAEARACRTLLGPITVWCQPVNSRPSNRCPEKIHWGSRFLQPSEPGHLQCHYPFQMCFCGRGSSHGSFNANPHPVQLLRHISRNLLSFSPSRKHSFQTTVTKPPTPHANPNYCLKTVQTVLKTKHCQIRPQVNQNENHHWTVITQHRKKGKWSDHKAVEIVFIVHYRKKGIFRNQNPV